MEGNITGRLNPKWVRFELTDYQNYQNYRNISTAIRNDGHVYARKTLVFGITEMQRNLGTVNTYSYHFGILRRHIRLDWSRHGYFGSTMARPDLPDMPPKCTQMV